MCFLKSKRIELSLLNLVSLIMDFFPEIRKKQLTENLTTTVYEMCFINKLALNVSEDI